MSLRYLDINPTPISEEGIYGIIKQTYSENVEMYKFLPNKIPTDNYVDLINLNNLLEDFSYIRNTLKENSENGKRILNTVSNEILASDPETLSEMVASYSDLNRSLTDTMKLYLQTYKDISNIILNLEKVKQGLSKTENNLNINNFGADKEDVNNVIKSTAEIIEKIRQKNAENS